MEGLIQGIPSTGVLSDNILMTGLSTEKHLDNIVDSSRSFISGVFFFLFLRFRSCFVTLARCVATGRGYSRSIFLFGVYTRCVQPRGRVLSPGLFLYGVFIRLVRSRGQDSAGIFLHGVSTRRV